MPLSRNRFISVAGLGAFAAVTRRFAETGDAAITPLTNFPRLQEKLRQAADKRVLSLSDGLRLTPERGAYAPALGAQVVEMPSGNSLRIAPDGLLTFALDVLRPVYVRATLELEPEADRRPGLRACLHSDTTLVGAPMLSAPAWGSANVTAPAPLVAGEAPETTVAVGRWLLPAGRRYLSISGPHFRPAGRFRSLTLRVLPDPVEPPLFSFAFISDTHLREEGRPEWMNIKMGEAAPSALRETLRLLAAEGIALVQHGGDMTEGATREEFLLLERVLTDQPLPVYGCIGNHDAYHPSSRPDALEVLAKRFPGGLDYTYSHLSLRFVVLDENLASEKWMEQKRAWLERTLSADKRTPTVLVWHYAPYNRGGLSNCGFRLQDWSKQGKTMLLETLRSAPNLVATLNGHDHWDEVNRLEGITHIQNAAFVEWPNTFRVFRVYHDRLEWEVRQPENRGYVRESFAVKKALSWMIATHDSDLTGVVRLTKK